MSALDRLIRNLEQGHLETAMEDFSQLKNAGTDDEKFDAAEELFALGFLDESRQLYEQLMDAYPDEKELVILLAEVYTEMDQTEESLVLLERITADNEFFPRAMLLSADIYQMQGLYEVSEQKLLQAEKQLPDEPVIQFALGELYNEQGRFLEAIRHYKQINHPEMAGVNINRRLGECYSAGGSFEDALPYYESALEDERDVQTLFEYAFTAYQASHYQTASSVFEELLEMDPEYHAAYLLLARAYEQDEELEKALDAAESGVKSDPFHKELFLTAGKLSLKLGLEQKAEEFIRQAIALDPDYLEAALVLNRILIHQERAEEVLEVIEIVRSSGEDDPQFNWDAAKAYEWQEQYDQALEEYKKAYVVYNDHTDFLSDYGSFLLEEGRREEARVIFEKLIENDPSNEEWQMTLDSLNQF
ncbi:tetratricopeptide repeat protein [Jeotgalibacillus aurantiacus]|uniref:tetratricopeptide repeat protein n=1 Tax=Jeotgalibacillus aurantiacus TaxID=2763266 RepID=UPI001D0A120A|nr:tetratricopeptide repeat protein [Jeotgalibacillus aurantiacus]